MKSLLILISVAILFVMLATQAHGQCPNGRCPSYSSATVTIPPAPAVAPAPAKSSPALTGDGTLQARPQALADRGSRWWPGKRVARWVRGR